MISSRERGYTFLPTYDSGLRDVGLVLGKRHPCDSFSHPRKRQRLSGQGVQRIQGHERVEAGPNNYSAFFLLNCLTDLFASRLTNQPSDYISWRPDPEAIHTDAFTINWAPLRSYAFPLFNLISKTLPKVTIDQTELILLARPSPGGRFC